MVNRLYLKEMLSFKELELEFKSGLIVFSGPSGAGKTILMQSILAQFGLGNIEARVCEIELKRPLNLEDEAYFLDEYITIKSIKKERSIYYLDAQKISKKRLRELFSPYIHYLSVRERSGLDSKNIIELLDKSISLKNSSYRELLKSFRERFNNYLIKTKELEQIIKKEKELEQRRDFLEFEIEKIDSISPKNGEYEELLELKQKLSKIDKIQQALQEVTPIFEFEEKIYELLKLTSRDSSYFSDAMNQLRVDLEEIETLSNELEEIDIEKLLERLEALSSLIKKYGSIEEALEYRDKKIEELKACKSIGENRSNLEESLKRELKELELLAKDISRYREKEAKVLKRKIDNIAKALKLPKVTFEFKEESLNRDGVDLIELKLENSTLNTLSGGEFNRLRLALMSVALEHNTQKEGVIFLDEIDANVSGDESIAIAKMVERLSNSYQIFAISHQPHLSVRANQHILVKKEGSKSVAKVLKGSDRVNEISRIISGEKADKDVLSFVKKLLDEVRREGC